MKYYSQYKQDEILNNQIFRNFRNGVFLDIGAHDGETLSNSLFFEEELGWSGICFEPIPEIFEKLKQRRKCICINAPVYNKKTSVNFLKNNGYTEMLSGILETYDSNHKQRITDENKQYGGESETIQLETVLLNDVLEEYDIKTIDYLSIDTEGSEFEILSSIDYEKYNINVISVEVNYPTSTEAINIEEFLSKKEFYNAGRLGCDLIYMNKNTTYNL